MQQRSILMWLLTAVACATFAQVIPVHVQKTTSGFQLLRGGQPYYIKGAGGFDYPERLAEYGGNSTRTWGTDANTINLLNDAHSKGISVMMGLWVMHEAHGFNYNDPVAVKKQLDEFKVLVQMYKDHPAVLAWGIGNEVELGVSNYNLNVWNAINDISKMIHEVDGNHPTLTVTAGIDPVKARHIVERAPDLDMLGVNAYGGIFGVFNTLKSTPGFDKPIVITEWGPNGQWEVPKTSFGVPIEQTSTEKAVSYKQRYEHIAANNSACVGSYVFLWSNKLEETPTWYGLFLPTGEETEAVDVMHYSWKGLWPSNRAPRIESAKIGGQSANESVTLISDKNNTATVVATDPDGDPLTYEFLILPATSFTGTVTNPPASFPYLPGLITSQTNSAIIFNAPEDKKNYRLYVIVRDNHNNIAVANVPFRVDLLPLVSDHPEILFTVRDAYVRDGNFASEAFGTTDALRLVSRKANEGANRKIFVEFDLASIDQGFNNVTLELFGSASSEAEVMTLFSTEAVWAETGITWNNRPTSTFTSADTTAVAGDGYFKWDVRFPVASAIARNETFITFQIENITETSSTITWNSREMRSNPPRLVFKFDGSELVTSTAREVQPKFTVAPNPSHNKIINVQSTHTSRALLRIINNQGIEVYRTIIQGDATTIDLNDMPTGIYFVLIDEGDRIEKQKIILR